MAITLASALWQLFVMVVSMLISYALRPKIKKPKDPGVLVNTKELNKIVPLVYGKTRVGGNLVCAEVAGEDNLYLHFILVLAEGECEGIENVSVEIEDTNTFEDLPGVYLNGEHYSRSDYKNHFNFEFFNGSANQTKCTDLFDVNGNLSDPYKYTSYLYCKFIYDRDDPLARPTVTVLLKGKKVKDFTNEDDYDSMPEVYSNNIAHCIYDMLTRPSSRGGKGIQPNRIDLISFREAAIYYDKYGWTANIYIADDNSVEDNLESLLINGRSELIYSNGNLFCLKFKDLRDESVVKVITKDDIIQDDIESTMEITPAASLFSRPNTIKTTYINEDKNYTEDVKVYSDNDAINSEGDVREISIELGGLTSITKIIPMSYYYLERARWGNRVKMTVGNIGLELEPMDLIKITADMPGWSDNSKPTYRVENSSMQNDGNVTLSLIQEHENLYNDNYDIGSQKLYYTNLLSPGSAVQGVINVSYEEEVYYYRQKSFTRWLINFDPPPVTEYAFWDYAEIWLKIGTGEWKFMTMARSDYMLDPVEEGVQYFIKIRSVSTFGVKEDFNSAHSVSKIIVGKTAAPTDMSYLTVSSVNDSLFITGEEIKDPDIVGYEFRISTKSAEQPIYSWEGSVYLGFNSKPNWSLSGIRSGSYRIFCCAINDGGLYSDNAVYADFDVQEPKGYTLCKTKDFNYPDGAHNNTEYYELAAGDWCVRVNHVGGLEGTWTSPIYDIVEDTNYAGDAMTLRVQGDFVLKVTDQTSTWDKIWPVGSTWDSKDISKSWFELTGIQKASKVNATLKWGVNDVNENSVDKFELMSIDTVGRYYQVVVTIIDPNDGQYVYLNGSGENTVLTLAFMR